MNETNLKEIKSQFFQYKDNKNMEGKIILNIEVKFMDCNCIEKYRKEINNLLENIGIPVDKDKLKIIYSSANERTLSVQL